MTKNLPENSEVGPDIAARTLRFSASDLLEFGAALLSRAGATPEESRIVAQSLVESNLRGHDSHGVFRVADYIGQMRRKEVIPGAPFTLIERSPSRLIAHGNHGFGQVQCERLIEQLLPMARETGCVTGTVLESGHVGRLGEWVEIAAKAGFAALFAVNDNGVPRTVAPPGGLQGRISTNPVAIGVPTRGEPFVLDISTSAVANGKVTVARLAGQSVPDGWLQDAQGEPTNDPNVLKQDPPGALLPFGGEQGYKAFGLALMLDILIGGLSGGYCPPAPAGTSEYNNILMVVWDPARFAGQEHFLTQTESLLQWIRDTPAKPGTGRVTLPGDRSARTHQERLQTGIPLTGDNWRELEVLAREYGVETPKSLT